MYTLSTNDIVTIRDALLNGVSVEALAEEYGISEAMVIAIRDGEDPFANQIVLDERAVLRIPKKRRRGRPSKTGFEQRLAQLESALAELLRIQRLQQERIDKLEKRLSLQPKTGQPQTEQPNSPSPLASPLVSPMSIPKPTFWQSHRGKILWLGGVAATLGFNWIVFPQQVQAYWFNWVILSLVGWPLLLIWTVLHWLHLT